MPTLPLLLALACTEPLPVDRPAPPSPVPALTLASTPLLAGEDITFTVEGLAAGERAWVLYGRTTGAGYCPPIIGGLCLDLPRPVIALGSATADPSGAARLTLTAPGTLATGTPAVFQAVAIRGAGGSSSVKSPALQRLAGHDFYTLDELTPGDLLITEIMKDPTVAPAATGQWIEVRNDSGYRVELQGLVLSDLGGDRAVVERSLMVETGDYVILGASTDLSANGQVQVAWAWSGFFLEDAADEVILSTPTTELDRVEYDDQRFPDLPGQTLNLDPARNGPSLNDDSAWWCPSPAGGTPLADNIDCPDPNPCGNGALDPGELCDDGGLALGDGCDATCQFEGCPVDLQPRSLTSWAISVPNADPLLPVASVIMEDGDVVWLSQVNFSNTGEKQAHLVRVDGETHAVEWAILLDNSDPFTPVALTRAANGGLWVVSDMLGRTNLAELTGQGTVLQRLEVHHRNHVYKATPVAAAGYPDGGVAITGHWDDGPGRDPQNGFVVALSPTGDVRWSHTTDNNGHPTSSTKGAWVLADQRALIWTASTGNGLADQDLTLFSAAGDRLWKLNLSEELDLSVTGVAELYNGDLAVIGNRMTGTSGFVIVLDANGQRRWSRLTSAPAGQINAPDRVWPSANPCAAGTQHGATCSTAGDRCAASTGQECSCTGSVWSCGAESTEIIVGSRTGTFALS